MARTKIELNVSVLGQHSRVMHVVVRSTTTCAEVMLKALQKCRVDDPPIKYQLWVVAKDNSKEKPLRDEDRPLQVLAAWKAVGAHFHLRLRTSRLLRVYHRLDGDFQSFQSLIVTPSMHCSDIVQVVVGRVSPGEQPEAFDLVEKTAVGEDRVIGKEERPFFLLGISTHLELRRKQPHPSPKQDPSPTIHRMPRTVSPLTSKTIPPVRELSPGQLPPPTPDSGLPQSPAVANLTFDSSLSLSSVELNRGKLQFHSDLIEALRQFAVQRSRATDEPTEVKTREGVLEQALVEQNQILEVMQKLVTSLEMENKSSREKINSQARKIGEMTVWEARAKQAEDQLREVAKSGIMGSSKAGMISFAAIAGFEKVLAEKDQLIASLQAKLESIPLEVRHRMVHEHKPASAALLASAQAKLETERVRVLEVEEELCSHREELSRVRNELSEKCSILIKQESEILHLRHEMEVVKKFDRQQQDVVMSLQMSLTDKDLQLTSLTRALSKEKKTSEQLRTRQQSTSSPHTANRRVHPNLFQLVLGRDINAFELRRTEPEMQLGFSFTKIDLPVSSKVPCLVVRAVKEASIADGVLHPGDEILEVNGFSCRSAAQSNAVECLEKAVGTLKLVVARDQEPTEVLVGPRLHSTPVKSENESTKWATAFSDLEVTTTTPEFVSAPSSPHSSKAFTLRVIEEDKPLNSSEEQSEETDLTMLRSELEESKRVQLELENEMEEVKGELDDLQVEYDLTKGENFELQQHVSSHAVEMEEIREHVSELQHLLKQVEEEVTEEQERAASLHARNQCLAEQLHDSHNAYEEEKKEVKATLEKLTLENNEMVSALQDEISSQHDQLISEASEKDKLIEDLMQQLQNKSAEYNLELSEMQGQNKQLQEEVKLLHESSAKNVRSTQEEVRHLTMQLSSAKAVLMETEMKESSMKVEMKHLKQAADLANQQLEEALRNISRLCEEVGTYKQVAETKTIEMESLTIGLKAAQGKLKANKDMVLRLQNEVDNLRRNNASLQNEKGRAEEARSRIESRLRVEESERISMEERLRSSTDEKDLLFRQLEDSIAEVVVVQQQVEVLNTKLQAAHGSTESTKQHQAQLEKQVKELSATKRSLEADFTKQVEVLKAEKMVLEQEVRRARGDAATTLETSQSSVDQAAMEMKNLHGELEQQQKALIASEGERAWLVQECESFKKSESRCSQQLESLRTENEALTHTVSILKTAKEDTERECMAKQKRVEELEQQCNSLKEEATSLEKSSELLRRKAKESSAEIERFSRSQQEWEDQMLDLQLQLGQLSREVEQKTQDLQDLAAVCEQLREELTLEKTGGEQLKVNVKSLQETIDNLQALKKQSDELVTSMELVHKQDQGKLGQMVDLLREREEAVRRTTEELATLRSEVQSQVQQMRTENTSLSENIEGLTRKLQAKEKASVMEVSDLREQLHSRDGEISELKENVRVQKETGDKHRAIISELQATASHATKERHASQKSLDAAESMKNQMELNIVQLQNQIAQIESEKRNLENANVALSAESLGLKQQLRQSGAHVDDLSAQLQALEMNLEVANRSLEESERVKAELGERSESLNAQLSKTTSKLESLEEEVVKTSLDLHARDEIILQLKTNLDLRQSESTQLQQSLIVAQNTVSSRSKRVESLEGRKRDLESTIEQLTESQEALKNSLLTLEAAKTTQLGKHTEEIAKFTQEIEDLHARERDRLEQIRKLDLAYSESQNMAEQLLASQKALQQSLAKLGDEKDVEIVKLCNRVTELESSLSDSKHQLSGSRTREVELQAQVQQLEEGYKGLSEHFKKLEAENEWLRSEVELHKATAAQISELSTKVSSLEETLRAKSNRLAEVVRVLQERESELKVIQEENASLLGKVSELASVKVFLAEKSTELEKVRGEVISEVRKTQEVVAERDQLLSMLRKLEVEKHTKVVQQPTPKMSRGADKEQLVELLKDKEEEAFRLREYVGKLLTNVVEKAPFVLENMH